MFKSPIHGLCRMAAVALLWLTPAVVGAQNEEETEADNDGLLAGFFDATGGSGVKYSTFKLPPLEILFNNARTNPSIELLAKEEQLARELLKKEKTEFLSHITGHAGYTYGIMDNYGSNSSVITPIYYQYMGSKQHYWNIGASISFSVEDIIDIGRKVKRKRLEAEKAGLQKDIAFEELKQQIVTLYVQITNDLVSLKSAAENAASYKGAGLLNRQEFIMGDVTVRDMAETKRWESTAIQEYQTLQSKITTNILILEIITHTPIITNIINNATPDNE